MNETQRNIKRYKAALPGLRERITATAMLLLVSLSMLVSTSLAWITLSIAPEVSLVTTTVASNGNLEIALAHGTVQSKAEDREKPEEVALGDSSATEGQTLVGSNITWGNLVNLSDSSYGMSHISLRPAMLADNNQSVTPLKGMDYTLDGRIIESKDYYRYASYSESFGANGGFLAGQGVQYGLRAISSMTMSNDQEMVEISKMGDAVDEQMKATRDAYNAIITSSWQTKGTHMYSLIQMLQRFVNNKASEVAKAKFGDDILYTPADYSSDVDGLYKLLGAFQDMLHEESETIRLIVNMHIFDNSGEKTDFIPEADTKNGELKGQHIREKGRTTAGRKELQDLGVPKELTDLLANHVKDYDDIVSAMSGIAEHLKPMVEAGEPIYWDSDYMADALGKDVVDAMKKEDPTGLNNRLLITYISNLVSIGESYVGPNSDGTYTSSVNNAKMKKITALASMDDALAIMGADPIEVEIGAGVLVNTEERIGNYLYKNNYSYGGTAVKIKIDIKLKEGAGFITSVGVSAINGDKPGAVRTSVNGVAQLDTQINAAKKLVPEPKSMVSKDIYGFAIDLWARTNAEDTILTLEGMTEYQEVRGTCIDKDGNTADLWTMTYQVPNESGDGTEEKILDVYKYWGDVPKKDENGEYVTDAEGKAVMIKGWVVYDALGHGNLGIWDEMNTEGSGYVFEEKMVKVSLGYYGENRVWQEMIDGGVIPKDSTTQGAGSCYVFYASPADQPRILEMLQSFTVAFLDGDDNLVATAKLDTTEAFDINGKVTVPLKVVDGLPYVDYVRSPGASETEEPEPVDKKGIMKMTRGEATWLTAIVYLDGDQLGNDNVLAAGSIEGRLNLQFGSSVDINSQKNEPLLKKYRTITAVVESNGTVDDGTSEVPLVEFDYDNTAKKVTARLTIEGDQPTNVTAFFTRMVGQNQGTRMETEVFRRVGETTEWVAEFELTKPGEYRLNSVVADGTEYVLEKRPGVKIKGQTTSPITCTPGGGSVMTSERYYDVQLSMSITTASEDLQPEKVQVQFSYGNNKTAVANMVNKGDGNWSGTLTITESGNYVMTYLVMDGNIDPVQQQTSIFVQVGIEAGITCADILDKDGKSMSNQSTDEGTYSILFEPPGEGKAYTAKMQVKLHDGSGNEITRMGGLKLVYPLDSDPSKKMDADLLWVDDPSGGYYQADMSLKDAGTYVFGWVETDDQTILCSINAADPAMKIAAVPPDPPAVPEAPNNTNAFQYVPYVPNDLNAKATMSVQIYDSAAAVVEAKIVNLITGQSVWVSNSVRASNPTTEGGHKTIETYTFIIPDNNHDNGQGSGTKGMTNTVDGKAYTYADNFNDSQDGIWALTELRMQQVTDQDKNYYPVNTAPDAAYLSFDMAGYGIRTEVMQKVFTEFTRNGIPYVGQSFSGVILEEHKISSVKFRISDWRGSMDHISGVTLTIDHNETSTLEHGGYTTSYNADQSWLTSGTAAEYNLKELTLQVAGTYKVKLGYKITVDGESTAFDTETGIAYTVSTPTDKRPTVAITGITPAGGTTMGVHESVDSTADHNSNGKMPAATFPATEVTVYFKCDEKTQNCSTTHTFTQPTVEIQLAGKGNAEKAELIFTPDAKNTNNANKSDVYMYNGNSKTDRYTWTADGKVSLKIGYRESENSKRAAETVNGTTLVLSGDGIECSFALKTPIIIHNPY